MLTSPDMPAELSMTLKRAALRQIRRRARTDKEFETFRRMLGLSDVSIKRFKISKCKIEKDWKIEFVGYGVWLHHSSIENLWSLASLLSKYSDEAIEDYLAGIMKDPDLWPVQVAVEDSSGNVVVVNPNRYSQSQKSPRRKKGQSSNPDKTTLKSVSRLVENEPQ